ncbi:NAD(P)-dependent oxidoreductase [Aliidiomarina minuta]|uniref:NAD(P)-dependent oxidoreductase n=2 Tax=Aliidiomarina minuta TaxID=880057 RepID=A0A432W413_9GAMM|nr:NAD(P)-dependent oxidoreductase [Aliidiomarina minuta]
MQVSVIGANGKIGKQLVAKLHQDPQHDVVALVRKQEQLDKLGEQGINACLLDLTASVADIAAALSGSDAVVFAAGSGASTEDDMTLRIDLDGAVKSIEAAQQAGIKRFVMVSAMQAHNRENWHPDLVPYFVAKHYADRELIRSGLAYTIVRPGALVDEEATGKVSIAGDLEPGSITRADVASVVHQLIDKPNTAGKAFDLINGDSPIEEAINKL